MNDVQESIDMLGDFLVEAAERKRVTFLRVDQVRILDHWCKSLRLSEIPYLVGSAITRSDFRDVDIRVPLDDEKFDAIPLSVKDLNMMLSRWGQDTTGLPIDCQVQKLSEFREHSGPAYPRLLMY